MSTSLRIGLRTASVFTFVVAGWLVGVVLSGRAQRGQDLVVLWSTVAAGSLALAALSMLATRPSSPASGAARAALGLVGAAALAFGLLVLGSELTAAATGDPEGYLFVLGLILALNGGFALAWLAVSWLATRARRIAR